MNLIKAAAPMKTSVLKGTYLVRLFFIVTNNIDKKYSFIRVCSSCDTIYSRCLGCSWVDVGGRGASCCINDSGGRGRGRGSGSSARDWKLASECNSAAECSCALRRSSATLEVRASSLGQQGQGAPQPVEEKKDYLQCDTQTEIR